MKSSNVGRPSLSPPATIDQRVQTTKSAIRQSLEKGLANPELRAQKVNGMYDHQFAGHGNSRHGAQTTTQQHEQRVFTGARPDGGADSYAPRTSSHWNNQQSQLAARHAAQSEFQNNKQTGHSQPTQENGNLAFKPLLGRRQETGISSTRQGSARNPTGIRNTQTTGASVILRSDGSYLTDFPE